MSERRTHMTAEERAGLREAVKKDHPGLTSFQIDVMMPLLEARLLNLENAILHGDGSGVTPAGIFYSKYEQPPEQPPV